MLKSLKEQGFELCTVSELLLEGDYTIDSNGTMMPKSKATVNQIIYSDNHDANLAFETLAEKLSISDINALQSKDVSIETARKFSVISYARADSGAEGTARRKPLQRLYKAERGSICP